MSHACSQELDKLVVCAILALGVQQIPQRKLILRLKKLLSSFAYTWWSPASLTTKGSSILDEWAGSSSLLALFLSVNHWSPWRRSESSSTWARFFSIAAAFRASCNLSLSIRWSLLRYSSTIFLPSFRSTPKAMSTLSASYTLRLIFCSSFVLINLLVPH